MSDTQNRCLSLLKFTLRILHCPDDNVILVWHTVYKSDYTQVTYQTQKKGVFSKQRFGLTAQDSGSKGGKQRTFPKNRIIKTDFLVSIQISNQREAQGQVLD